MPHSPTIERPQMWSAQKRALPARRIALVLAVGLLLVVSVWFRLRALDRLPGLNGDEAWYGVQAVRLANGEWAAWRTPTGNVLNLLFVGPLVLLHTLFSPSVGLLRSVSVASGLLALAANYWLCRRVFDQTTAVVSTIVLAVLPVMIAYSRFAWDASQTPLVSVLVVYTAMALGQRREGVGSRFRGSRRIADQTNIREINSRPLWVAVTLSLVLACWVHPTNVFLVPLVVVCVMPPVRLRRHLSVAAFLLALVLFAWRGPVEVVAFVPAVLRLFSGVTVCEFISLGTHGDVALSVVHVLTVAFIAWALWGLLLRIRQYSHKTADVADRTIALKDTLSNEPGLSALPVPLGKRDLPDQRLAIGMLASLGLFLLVAGGRGVQPHFERYAMWMIVPGALLVSRGIGYWLLGNAPQRMVATVAGLLMGALLLVEFERCYFDVFRATGGESHLAFRVGTKGDLKHEALQHVLAVDAAEQPLTIVSRNWWTRLPLAYFASMTPGVAVVESPAPHQLPGSTRICLIELAGSSEELALKERLDKAGVRYSRSTCDDLAGRAVIAVYWPLANRAESPKIFSSP